MVGPIPANVNGLKALPVLEGFISDEVLPQSQRMDRCLALRGIGGETNNPATESHLCRRKEHRANGGKLRNEAQTKRVKGKRKSSGGEMGE